MRAALYRLSALFLFCLLLGWASGYWGWVFALALLLHGLVYLWQVSRLARWLQAPQESSVPQARGLWGELFDALYRRERRQQKEQARLKRIIERIETATGALQDALLLLDGEGQVHWWNPAAQTLLGLKSRQDSGQLLCNLIRHPDFRSYLTAEENGAPLLLPSPLDASCFLQFKKTRYGSGECLLWVRDVTRMQQLEQMRRDFVDNLSHELRTPLTVLVGYLETLQDGREVLNRRAQKALAQMQSQADRMQRLLADLLLLAELEGSPPAEAGPVDVARLLATLTAEARVLAEARNQRISLQAQPSVQLGGSAEELRSAFANLLHNALKYSENGSEVQLNWWGDEEGAHLSVQDKGCGIEAEHIPRLTERFYRANRRQGGSGLGLAIVKHVLLRHGGHLSIQSKPGEGSTFICHFPPQGSQPAQAA